MIPANGPALNRALALLQDPRGVRPGPGDSLPADMRTLLQIVSGDPQALAQACQRCGEQADRVREAAVFYIQQVMFAPGSDSYRILGVDTRARDEQIKAHYRWLVRWLHPDRNPDEWEAIYAERVNRAWQELRTVERRQRHDRFRAAMGSPKQATRPAVPDKVVFAAPRENLSSVVPGLRWLPTLVFSALGVSALLAIGLFYALSYTDKPPSSEIAVHGPSQPVPQAQAVATVPDVPAPIAATVDSPVLAESVEASPPADRQLLAGPVLPIPTTALAAFSVRAMPGASKSDRSGTAIAM